MYAGHHAGGWYALWRPVDADGRQITATMMDSDDFTHAMVHVVDFDRPDDEVVELFDNGHDALQRFLQITGLEQVSETPYRWRATPAKED